jgi:hypothetical protein
MTLDMIINPGGPNLKETETLIKYISIDLDNRKARDFTLKTVNKIIKGYEFQAGKEYDGYKPDDLFIAKD